MQFIIDVGEKIFHELSGYCTESSSDDVQSCGASHAGCCEFIGRCNAQTDEHNCTADCGIEYDCSSRSRRLVAISSSSSAGVVLQLTSHKAALPTDRQLSGMPEIRRFSREISARLNWILYDSIQVRRIVHIATDYRPEGGTVECRCAADSDLGHFR